MKIVFLDFDDINNPLLSGGQARATFEVTKRLVELGHFVTVISSKYPNYKDGKNEGVYHKHIGLGTSNIKINNALFFFALPFAVRKIEADVILECFTAPISTCFSPLFTKVPVIGMSTIFQADEFSKKYHLPFSLIEKIGSRFYKYFLAYSPIAKKKMESLNPKIITKIIPNGVEEKYFKITTKGDKFALFIGRIDIHQKGLDLLLKAFQKIYKKVPIDLIIAGNGPSAEEDKLRKLITDLNLSSKVHFIGRVDGKKKESLLAQAMFGIYPSRFESFGITALEFMAMGKPVVRFDIAGLKWITQDVSIQVKPFQIQSLAKAILDLSTNYVLRNKIKSKCKVFASKYGWKKIAKMYEKFFQEVIFMEKRQVKGIVYKGSYINE